MFYSTEIFKNAGLKEDMPIYATIVLGVVQLIMTFVCMLIVDKAGRKILLLLGMSGMSIFSFLLTICRIYGVNIKLNVINLDIEQIINIAKFYSRVMNDNG